MLILIFKINMFSSFLAQFQHDSWKKTLLFQSFNLNCSKLKHGRTITSTTYFYFLSGELQIHSPFLSFTT